jgi:peptidyl-prolyl cis-trans isomerase B (cyclophilin B)
MAGTKRERQLARERYVRQQARRAMRDAQRRRRQQIIAAVVAVALAIGGVVLLARYLDKPDVATAVSDSPTPTTEETPTDTPSSPEASPPAATTATTPKPTDTVSCTYTPGEQAAKKNTAPEASAVAGKPYTATLKMNTGTVRFTTAAAAPCTSRSFASLAKQKYFDGTTCHRLTTSGLFVLQCGDPTGSGSGGPGYGFGLENTPPDGKFPAGTVAMARANDPNSNGSQFFLVYKDTELPTDGGGYTIFGKVTSGLDVLEAIAKAGVKDGAGDGAPAKAVRLESVTTSGS